MTVAIFSAANGSCSRFFDDKLCWKVFICLPFYRMCLQCSDSFALHIFPSLTEGVMAGKRSLESGGCNIAAEVNRKNSQASAKKRWPRVNTVMRVFMPLYFNCWCSPRQHIHSVIVLSIEEKAYIIFKQWSTLDVRKNRRIKCFSCRSIPVYMVCHHKRKLHFPVDYY